MKKILILFLVMALCASTASADEGMWLLPLLKQLNTKGLEKAGLKMSVDDIYSINHSSIKDAVVMFGRGCTGEVISKDGLLLTNHHCGYGVIQALSTVEHNYLQDGYWAMDRTQELPAPGLTVTFLEAVEDLSKQVLPQLEECETEEQRLEKSTALFSNLEKEYGTKYPGCAVEIMELYGGNMVYMFAYKTYKDVRFVGAGPSSIGKFGADTDNWMWPRHTCDFSMFRIYAGADNQPADYSPENKPYQPKKSLSISLAGVEENDFVMTLGYPGSTSRFMTSKEVEEQEEVTNNIGIAARTIRQDILLEDMLADPKVKLQYASKYSGSTNSWKKWMGMNETFAKLDVMERRAKEEARFTEWVNAKAKRQKRYGTAIEDINSAVAARRDASIMSRYLRESLSTIEIIGIASNAMRAVNATESVDDPRIAATLTRFYENYNLPTDIKVAKAMMHFFADNTPADQHPEVYTTVKNDFGGDIDAYVDDLFARSVFTSLEKAKTAIKNVEGIKALENDPAVIFAAQLLKAQRDAYQQANASRLQYVRGHRNYIAGTLEMNPGIATYPDANFTMRLTYGNVMSYSPKDAVLYNHYTTLTGVMEKEDPNNWEFIVPEKLKELYKTKDYGIYAKKGEEVRTCFIANTDITGGNSGSPVLNANGALVGIAFDGNWESMSGDVIFEPQLQRCIAVDIRYVLFIMDKFGGAGYLLKEMDIVK